MVTNSPLEGIDILLPQEMRAVHVHNCDFITVD